MPRLTVVAALLLSQTAHAFVPAAPSVLRRTTRPCAIAAGARRRTVVSAAVGMPATAFLPSSLALADIGDELIKTTSTTVVPVDASVYGPIMAGGIGIFLAGIFGAIVIAVSTHRAVIIDEISRARFGSARGADRPSFRSAAHAGDPRSPRAGSHLSLISVCRLLLPRSVQVIIDKTDSYEREAANFSVRRFRHYFTARSRPEPCGSLLARNSRAGLGPFEDASLPLSSDHFSPSSCLTAPCSLHATRARAVLALAHASPAPQSKQIGVLEEKFGEGSTVGVLRGSAMGGDARLSAAAGVIGVPEDADGVLAARPAAASTAEKDGAVDIGDFGYAD
jgi:hypothetical protein